VLAKHEQGAAFMAGGYARASGRIGACITTAGPGATNLVTGIANAYVDRQPILVVTGETSTHIFGRGGLQESSGEGGSIDQSALFGSITRYARLVERTDYLVNVLNRAARILLSRDPGPVLLSFPYNLQKEEVDASLLDDLVTRPPVQAARQDKVALGVLADLLAEAKNPVIVAGYGCIRSGAQPQVAALSERLQAPVTTSLKAKGVISEQSSLSLGSLGVTSSDHAYRYIVENADLVLFLGAGFNERTSYLWDASLLENCKVAQVDHDPEQLEKVFRADVAIAGDIGEILDGLLEVFEERQVMRAPAFDGPGMARLQGRKQGRHNPLFPEGVALVEHFFMRLEEHFPGELMVFDDNIIFAQNFFNVSAHNRYFSNSGISSLGHAIPAAIGARFAEEVPTFAILGDGGFQMCCMEIMTAVNYDIPLNVVLFNNATMGLIRKNQHQQYGDRFIDCDFVNPDYEAMARAFGVGYRRVEEEAHVDALFESLDLAGGINLVEIMVDRDAYPNYRVRR
jgi:acetolactate synthase-1/2/3 large subunit